MSDDILTSTEDGVLRLTFNHPERLNSVTSQILHELADLIEGADGVRVAVIAGEGRAFCAGAVMKPGAVDADILGAISRVITAITSAPFPVIAAVHGPAAGVGCSIAVACDIAVAASSAYFLQAFVNVGLMPDGAATELLAASIGRSRAMQLLLSGERVPAQEAQRIGLAASCVPDDEFTTALEAAVAKYAAGPTLAYARTKLAVNAASLPFLQDSLAREAEGQTALSTSADHAEGVAAFAAKRPPAFTGR